MKLGRRDHHHVVYHKDHGEVFGEGDAPLSLERVLENSLGWCRNTGINVFNFHINSHSRDFLGIDPCENAAAPFEHLGPWTIYETIRHHRENGVDLMAELGRAMRAAGIAFWAGLRVNDIHHTTGGESVHPRFWLEHPECRTGESVPWDPQRSPGALDFAHQAVRDYTLGIVEKTLELYDVDGIDLDFNRMPILFKSEETDQHRDTLTAWLAEVRAAVDDAAERREHPICLEVRVPSVADQCHRFGADVLTWIDRELVHIVTASSTRFAEFEMPLEPFLEAARDKDVLVFAGIEGLQADGVLSREMYRAWAYHYWQTGVDGLHLFNNGYNHIYGGGPHPVDELHDPDRLATLGKRYVITRTLPGRPYIEHGDPLLSYPKQLPRELSTTGDGKGELFEIHVDDDLEHARDADILEALVLRLRITELTRLDRIAIRMNGELLDEENLRVRGSGWARRLANLPNVYNAPTWSATTSGSYRWILCDLTQCDCLRSGSNQIEVSLNEKNPDVIAPLCVYNIEVDVKYRHIQHEGNEDTGRF